MSITLPAFRHLIAAVGVALASMVAALAIAQAPHVEPVSSAEVDGALRHLGALVAVDDSSVSAPAD